MGQGVSVDTYSSFIWMVAFRRTDGCAGSEKGEDGASHMSWGILWGVVFPEREEPCIKVLMLIQVHVPDAQ